MKTAGKGAVALVAAGTVVAGVALTAVPVQAAAPSQVATTLTPMTAANATLTPAQIKSIVGVPQNRASIETQSGDGVHGVMALYSQPKTGRLAIVGTAAMRATSQTAIQNDIRPAANERVIANTYNPRTKSGRLVLLATDTGTVKDAKGRNVKTRVYFAVSVRYTNQIAVAAFVVNAVPATSTNYHVAVAKSDQASKVLANRFQIVG